MVMADPPHVLRRGELGMGDGVWSTIVAIRRFRLGVGGIDGVNLRIRDDQIRLCGEDRAGEAGRG